MTWRPALGFETVVRPGKTYEKSQELFERIAKVTPGGAQTASKAPGRVGPLGAFPLYLERGDGPYVYDVDGHEYIDWFNGNCAVILGHGEHHVLEAVRRQLLRGVLLSLPTRLEGEVAERICDIVPCAEQVRFVKTGSEACAAAVRIARLATGKRVIVAPKDQYAGWHDWTIARTDYHPGVPRELEPLIRTFQFDDLESLRTALDGGGGGVAAVILEPALPHLPTPTHLEAIIDLAHAYGALVIFDEMISGNRLHVGGAQRYFGITPDLATGGKAYANGFPLAFICGPADLMRHAWPVSGTFGGEIVSLAACQEVLERSIDGWPVRRMAEVGQQLIDGVNGICARLELPAAMTGAPMRPVLQWSTPADERPVLIALLQQELAERGILAHPSGWNPSAAHDAKHVEKTLLALADALQVVVDAITSGRPATWLRGELIKPAFVRPA